MVVVVVIVVNDRVCKEKSGQRTRTKRLIWNEVRESLGRRMTGGGLSQNRKNRKLQDEP